MKKNRRLYLLAAFCLWGSLAQGGTPALSGPHYLPIKNGQIEYYRMGAGSPLVLVPGYATDVSSWSFRFLKTLAEQHELIIFNLRQVGGSKINSPLYKSYALAEDICALITKLSLQGTTLLGISMGGMIAQEAAITCPSQIAQLVLINTAIAGPEAIHPSPEMKQKLWNIPHNKLGFYWVALHAFFPPAWKPKMAYQLIVDRFHPKGLKPIDLAKVIPLQQGLIMDWSKDKDPAQKITGLPMPVLIINGQADQVIPPENSKILAKKIPKATLMQWPEGGHAIIYQYPEQIALKIRGFIEIGEKSFKGRTW